MMAGCLFCGSLDAPGIYKPHHPIPCPQSDNRPCSACTKMEELEERIVNTKVSLEKMLAQRRELRSQMNHIHNPIIHSIPPEISSSIFQFCLPETLPQKPFRKLTKIEICAPLILGAVCRTWRQIVWSSPPLWASITILLDDQKEFLAQYDVAQEWLLRSGQLPLAIQIHSLSISMETPHPLVDLINQYFRRWWHLYLNIPSYAMPLFGHSEQIPMLRSLKLKGTDVQWGRDRYRGFSSKVKMANSSPMTVSLSDFPVQDVIIDWTCVTHFHLEWHHDADFFFKVLREASRLNYCKVSIRQFENPVFSKLDKPVIHHRVQVLDVAITGDGWETFFDNLTLPALEDFTSEMSNLYQPPSFNSLISLFERSSNPLKTFKLLMEARSNHIGFADFPSLLRATPSLRTFDLCLSDRHLGRTYERVLPHLACSRSTNSHADELLLPVLESMTLTSLEGRFPWILVPPIFGFPCEVHSTHQRPLLKLDILIHPSELDEPSKEYIDQKAILRFLQLTQAGINVNIVTIPGGRDLLKDSMEHHGIEF